MENNVITYMVENKLIYLCATLFTYQFYRLTSSKQLYSAFTTILSRSLPKLLSQFKESFILVYLHLVKK